MSVSFYSSDYKVDCNFSNRNFSDIWKLLGFDLDDESWFGEMSPILLMGRVQTAQKNTVAQAVRPALVDEGEEYFSLESGNLELERYATVIDSGSTEGQIYNRLERLEAVCRYCIQNDQIIQWA
tara:strand:- start:1920 stop:2291 length:372 start_codon:yes stop_codon:yes gene_type:complete